jgi:hypothetical protein
MNHDHELETNPIESRESSFRSKPLRSQNLPLSWQRNESNRPKQQIENILFMGESRDCHASARGCSVAIAAVFNRALPLGG